jgi:hypothetical protein
LRDVAVIVPWQPGCVHRERALAWVTARWEAAGVRPVIGEIVGPWCKAAAVDAAVTKVAADVYVIHDADVWCDRTVDAVTAVASGRAAVAVPHTLVRRLSEPATAALYDGGVFDGPLDQAPYRGVFGGGITVVAADVYDRVPLDHRFVGWGQEDEAWGIALGVLARPVTRLAGVLWHLWHPPAERMSRVFGNADGKVLRRRYEHAARNRSRMEALLAEPGVRDRSPDRH